MWAVVKVAKGEIAVHTENSIALGKIVLFEPSVQMAFDFTVMLRASAVDVIYCEKLKFCYSTTCTS